MSERKNRNGKPTGRVLTTLKQLAAYLELSYSHTAHLAKQYNMPGQRGHYDLNEIDAWRERHKLRRKRSVVASPEDDLVEARRKLAVAKREEARAIREQHAAEREQGKLIDRVEAQKREEQIIDWAVSVMELAEAELPEQLTGKTTGAIRDCMREWFSEQRRKSLMKQ